MSPVPLPSVRVRRLQAWPTPTGTEQALLSQLPRGVALWRTGPSSFLVEHQLDLKSWPGRAPMPPCGPFRCLR
jgi:hypothetical protein